ncbi:DUF3795 domain-containing protein [uncultured Oscillibacter sp.]|uniref:DUF3795 domain-containing protein n=1 Tax=uncultured Oscillibacter sp. TaxID=876091 RepID=UPI00272EDE91|nr:DUF3795 domain-containing protein [uncultured Oscillibacter sp.]
MKGFNRPNQLFSLCGLNCGLCPMFLNKNCPGCGGGEGNQSCKIARCSLEHDGVEYCFQCSEYPCEKYEHIDDFDSFITHQSRKADLEKARCFGIEAYNVEQVEKAKILDFLLSNYNDGRKKTLFCVAVNLLDLRVLDGFPCLCCWAAKRAQSDKPLTLSIHYGMLRDRVCFSLDLSGITEKIRAGVRVLYSHP